MNYNNVWTFLCGLFGLLLLAACSPSINVSQTKELIAFSMNGAIWVMNPDGTNQHELMHQEVRTLNPEWSPDGRRLAFTGVYPDDSQEIFVSDSNGENTYSVSPKFERVQAKWLNPNVLLTTVITDTGQTWNNPQSQYVLNLQRGTLFEYSSTIEEARPLPQGERWISLSLPFSGTVLYSLKDRPRPILQEFVVSSIHAFDVSPAHDEIVFYGHATKSSAPLAQAIYRTAINSETNSIPLRIMEPECCITEIRWSPNGKWIALRNQNGDFSILDAGTNETMKLIETETSIGGSDFQWSPDSQWLLVSSMNYGIPGKNNILELAKISRETGEVVRLTNNDAIESSPDWGIVQK